MNRACWFLLCGLTACASAPGEYPTPLPAEPEHTELRRAALDASWQAFDPADVESVIWYGRQTAYLGDHRRAISIYTRGLVDHPDSAKLLRHRGHRHISSGNYALAVADLTRASELIRGEPDEVEPDGLPNARNTPTSTLHTNVWYHLGLAHYLRGDYADAQRCYERCLARAANRDMEAATRYWLFLSMRRQGLDAAHVLAPADPNWDIIENTTYRDLLLLFRGDLEPRLVDIGERGSVKWTTGAYGLARHAYEEGRDADGERLLRHVLRRGRKPAFGYLAAEADL